MIEVVLNDRLGKKVRVKCNEDDTIGDLKKLVASHTGTRDDKIRIQKWHTIYKDHITIRWHGPRALQRLIPTTPYPSFNSATSSNNILTLYFSQLFHYLIRFSSIIQCSFVNQVGFFFLELFCRGSYNYLIPIIIIFNYLEWITCEILYVYGPILIQHLLKERWRESKAIVQGNVLVVVGRKAIVFTLLLPFIFWSALVAGPKIWPEEKFQTFQLSLYVFFLVVWRNV